MASYTYEFLELGEEHSWGCKCCRFTNGVDLPIPQKHSFEEIAKLAKDFATSIFADWIKLSAIVKRFEGVIGKRWLRKTPKQRRDLFLKAWPDMATTHKPDFLGFRKVLKNAPRSRTCLSAAYLWPYVNLEDLQQRHHLSLFLNSRGPHLPEKFVHGDIREAHVGNGWRPAEDEAHFMEFHRQHTPRTYGALIKRKGCDEAQRVIIQSSLGLLALEIQQSLYRFSSPALGSFSTISSQVSISWLPTARRRYFRNHRQMNGPLLARMFAKFHIARRRR